MGRLRWGCGLAVALCVGCQPDDTGPDATGSSSGGVAEPAPRACIAPEGLGAPSEVQDVVALVNALPHPVTLPCFLESLDRPFDLYASSSDAGAQPASGERSPRLFIHRGDLIMTVVPEGFGSNKLEMSRLVGDRKSVKSELAFPVEEELSPLAPYQEVDAGGGTICSVCHDSETRYEPIQQTPAYASDVFQDDMSHRLPMGFAAAHARNCDPAVEPERCAMLTAVFAHGDLTPWDLPRDSKICR